MAIEFKLPELGENIVSGRVAAVLIKEGDSVTADQP
ncbi:biotin/lipoyl-containing protein, partial [Caldithrix abyssi]